LGICADQSGIQAFQVFNKRPLCHMESEDTYNTSFIMKVNV
jgi:hypothetical protein